MKIQQTKGGQFFLSLPRDIVRAKGWKKGDHLEARIDKDGEIKLRMKEYNN